MAQNEEKQHMKKPKNHQNNNKLMQNPSKPTQTNNPESRYRNIQPHSLYIQFESRKLVEVYSLV